MSRGHGLRREAGRRGPAPRPQMKGQAAPPQPQAWRTPPTAQPAVPQRSRATPPARETRTRTPEDSPPRSDLTWLTRQRHPDFVERSSGYRKGRRPTLPASSQSKWERSGCVQGKAPPCDSTASWTGCSALCRGRAGRRRGGRRPAPRRSPWRGWTSPVPPRAAPEPAAAWTGSGVPSQESMTSPGPSPPVRRTGGRVHRRIPTLTCQMLASWSQVRAERAPPCVAVGAGAESESITERQLKPDSLRT